MFTVFRRSARDSLILAAGAALAALFASMGPALTQEAVSVAAFCDAKAMPAMRASLLADDFEAVRGLFADADVDCYHLPSIGLPPVIGTDVKSIGFARSKAGVCLQFFSLEVMGDVVLSWARTEPGRCGRSA